MGMPKTVMVVLIVCGLFVASVLAETLESRRTGNSIPKPQSDRGSMTAVEPVIYKLSNGRIEIKPRLKYELIISLHVLKFAEDHHRLFTPWAEQMRKDLSGKTLKDATTLIENSHEWQLCFLVQDYDGPDTVDGLAGFVKNLKTVRPQDEDVPIDWWTSTNSRLINALGLAPAQFPQWYAGFLERYYYEAFEKQWLSEHRKLVYEDATSLKKELDALEFSPTAFMEELTGRRFTGSTRIILYPSSFSRPQHAYGFNEKGHKVAVYKIGGGKHGALASIFHELLHPLIRGWWAADRMRQPISELAKRPLFKASWEQKGKGGYGYPNSWLDELVVHAVSVYMEYKAGLITEKAARRQSYGSYENALYDAIFDRYDSFDSIDDFIFYAITHIKVSGSESNASFVYVRGK